MAILFSYHIRPDTCLVRLRQLRRQNPKVPIYGLYSGAHDNRKDFQAVDELLDHCWAHPPARPGWLWRNYDKAISLWHKQAGEKLIWDHLFIHAWDLLLAEPVEHFMQSLEPSELFLPGLRRLDQMDEQVVDPQASPRTPGNWSWLREEPEPLAAFGRYLLSTFGRIPELYCEVSPFAVLSRPFCDQYSRMVFPVPGFNEYRFPTLVEPLGFRFAQRQLSPHFWRHYNAEKVEISADVIAQELSDPNGARLFHPVYQPIEGLLS